MNRRDWIRTAAAGSIGVWSTRLLAWQPMNDQKANPSYDRFPFEPADMSMLAAQDALPFDVKRILVDSEGIVLQPKGRRPRADSGAVFHFRITTATNYYELAGLQLSLLKSGRILTELKVNYACPMQPFEGVLDPASLAAIYEEGIRLRQIDGAKPIEIFCMTHPTAQDCVPWVPHIVETRPGFDRKAAMFEALFSTRTLAPFGWEEGCVTDALWQLYEHGGYTEAKAALQKRFKVIGALHHDWVPPGGFHSIESTLPLAALARLDPRHPILGKAIEFWQSRHRDNNVVADYSATAEGSYTIAYPLAVLARLWERQDLGEWALQQLRLRKIALAPDGDIYLRQNPKTLSRSYKNWSRGIAWYLLGLLRTLEQIGNDFEVADLEDEFRRVVRISLDQQRSDGLWSCFLDTPEIRPDTAGSAGIAAAITGGIRNGYLKAEAGTTLQKTWSSLLDHLTGDGLLTGVAQSNKGGVALQRSDFRVSMAMGLGLLGQLAVDLGRPR